jgi:hypothetical protein
MLGGNRMKTYIGVSSLDKSGIFYFNIHTLSFIKFTAVRKDSMPWLTYLEYCEHRNIEPVTMAFFMAVGTYKGTSNFLVSRKKMKDVKFRMAKFLCHPDDLETEEE